jgi:hypothetical protein
MDARPIRSRGKRQSVTILLPKSGRDFPNVLLFAQKAVTVCARDDDMANAWQTLEQAPFYQTPDRGDGEAQVVCSLSNLESASLSKRNSVCSARRRLPL